MNVFKYYYNKWRGEKCRLCLVLLWAFDLFVFGENFLIVRFGILVGTFCLFLWECLVSLICFVLVGTFCSFWWKPLFWFSQIVLFWWRLFCLFCSISFFVCLFWWELCFWFAGFWFSLVYIHAMYYVKGLQYVVTLIFNLVSYVSMKPKQGTGRAPWSFTVPHLNQGHLFMICPPLHCTELWYFWEFRHDSRIGESNKDLKR